MIETAAQCWQRLSGVKESLMFRVENYASLTIPKICLPDGFDQESTDQTHDYQSIGAQAVNHLTNKIMLALFAPSRPFFRIGTGKKTQQQMAAQNVPEADIATILAKMERDAVKELDALGQRPKLYSTIRHLIITGNVLMFLDKKNDAIRVMGLRYYCVKRDANGALHTLVIRERIKFDELDKKAKEAFTGKYQDDTFVDFYKYIVRNDNGDYEMTQWVDHHKLGEEFNGKWPLDKLPYRVLTWDLADEADYGTGLVEEYCGDLEAMSVLSESVVDGAVMATEIRWLVNPTGTTSVDDVNLSKNGDALAGRTDDIAPTQALNAQAVEVADRVLQRFETRVSKAFLLFLTRDAERVTAEEIRMTAQELETAYGGIYSALAQSIQAPVANWLLSKIDVEIAGTDFTVTVLTGLDALSRNGDLENLRAAFSVLAGITQATAADPQLSGRLKWNPLVKAVGDGVGVDLTPFLKTDEEVAEEQKQAQQARVAEEAAVNATANQGTM